MKMLFTKLVHLVGFIIKMYHDAQSPERQFITMHGHLNVNLSRCTVTWTSIYHDALSPERQFITMHGHLNVNLSRCTVTLLSSTNFRKILKHQISWKSVRMELCSLRTDRQTHRHDEAYSHFFYYIAIASKNIKNWLNKRNMSHVYLLINSAADDTTFSLSAAVFFYCLLFSYNQSSEGL